MDELRERVARAVFFALGPEQADDAIARQAIEIRREQREEREAAALHGDAAHPTVWALEASRAECGQPHARRSGRSVRGVGNSHAEFNFSACAMSRNNVKTIDDAVRESLWRQRLQGQVLGIFAGLALALAMVGIYGVISYSVAQRTRELGVRLALGGQRGDVLSLVLLSGVRLAAVGIVIGLVGGLALSQSLAALLYGVTPRDLTTFTVVPVVLGVVTLVATYVPARRATKVDPLVAIRAEQ
jgi:hypothetical protein